MQACKALAWSVGYIAIYLLTQSLTVFGGAMLNLLWLLPQYDLRFDEDVQAWIDGAVMRATDQSAIWMLVAIGASMVLYVCLGKLRRRPLRSVATVHRLRRVEVSVAVIWALGARFLTAAYAYFASFAEPLRESMETMESALSFEISTLGLLLAFFLLTNFLGPAFEEFMVRGLVMHELRPVMPFPVMIVVQSALFGIMHGFLFQSLFAGAVGVLFGLLYALSGNLYASVLMHILFNLTSLLTVHDTFTACLALGFGVLLIVLGALVLRHDHKHYNIEGRLR